MAGTNNDEYPIPMLDTAEAIVDSDDRIKVFISSLFPNVTPDQFAMMKLFAIGWFMEGEEMGRILAKHAATDDLSKYRESDFEDLESNVVEEHTLFMRGFCPRHKQPG